MKRCIPAAMLLLGGCYGYYPVSSPAPAGRDVQVMLTDSGSVVLASKVGPQAQYLLGNVAGDSAGSVVLTLASVRTRGGDETTWRGERVVVPHPLMASIEERRFSRARTTLFSGAVVVALVALRQGFSGIGGSTGGSGLPTTGTRQ